MLREITLISEITAMVIIYTGYPLRKFAEILASRDRNLNFNHIFFSQCL